jgi:hypothetical protein
MLSEVPFVAPHFCFSKKKKISTTLEVLLYCRYVNNEYFHVIRQSIPVLRRKYPTECQQQQS